MDNKIHTKDQLTNLLNDNIPVIAEIPFIKILNQKVTIPNPVLLFQKVSE